MGHVTPMECVVYNVYVRLLTFNLSYRFQCTYNGAHHLTVVLSRSHHFHCKLLWKTATNLG